MIKLRVRGTEEEIQKFTDRMRELEDFAVLMESEPYKDRGKSEYNRVYMEVETMTYE